MAQWTFNTSDTKVSIDTIVQWTPNHPNLQIESDDMMPRETILVTGAAGSVGSTARTAITILLERGHRIRAMVRKLDARADTLRDMGAEVVVADMLDIIGVRAAMQECSVVYFTDGWHHSEGETP